MINRNQTLFKRSEFESKQEKSIAAQANGQAPI